MLPDTNAVATGRETAFWRREVDRFLDRLAGALSALPSGDPFHSIQLRSDMVAACVLDGETVSLPDLVALESGLLSPDRSPAADRALRAVRWAELALRTASDRPLDPAGLARSVVEVVQHCGLGATEGSGSRADALERVLRWHGERSHPDGIVGVAVTQARIELAGPFGPANGLAGRLIATMLLSRLCGSSLGYARFLLREEERYRRSLDSVPGSDTWDDWILFFLERVCESAADRLTVIPRFVAMRERHRQALASNLGYAVAKGLAILERLYRRPLVTVAEVQGVTGTSYVAANTLVRRLVDLGILEEVTGYRRNRVFRYRGYTALFDASDSLPARARPAPSPAGPARVQSRAQSGPALRKGPLPLSDHLL